VILLTLELIDVSCLQLIAKIFIK
jgi:hypothetical protein